MNKKILMFVACGLVAATGVSQAATRVQTSPFSDNLAVNLVGFSPSSFISARYKSNNNVNISGPRYFIGGQGGTVNISSNNLYQNGYPSMTLTRNGNTCALNFIDGPWSQLAFTSGNPPTCAGITVSNITETDQYNYSVTIAKG